MRTATNSPLFPFVDGLGGQAMTRDGAITSDELPDASALDLDEDEHRPATDDQIDLDATGADVARDDAISSRFEKLGGSRLTNLSQFLSWIRHGSIRREAFALVDRVG